MSELAMVEQFEAEILDMFRRRKNSPISCNAAAFAVHAWTNDDVNRRAYFAAWNRLKSAGVIERTSRTGELYHLNLFSSE